MHQRVENPLTSIILPTYNEAENIKLIIPKLSRLLNQGKIGGEIIVVDDDSPDGTPNMIKKLKRKYPVRILVRKNERGLATAVIKGFQVARGNIIVVMDADLSHPIEKIPDMIEPILEGKCDATVGSRYVAGGGSEKWPLIRKVISKGSGLLARGVTKLSDPTSGFMAVRKNILQNVKLDPIGWKIVLETIVKTNCHFLEVPIIFADRQKGKSKLNLKAQIDYMRHLWRLYCYKYPAIYQFMKFCLVGTSGLLIDTVILIILVDLLFFDPRFAAIFAFCGAVSWNYIFNRLWTFEFGRFSQISYSYVSFVSVCLFGLLIRIGIMHLLIEYLRMSAAHWYVLASILGIITATIFNFVGSKYIAFAVSSAIHDKWAKITNIMFKR
ncbi:MAG: glycosyltransferase [Candidatus Hodarchaeota archaeon]